MAINIFEGARRIAKLIAALIVVGYGIAIVGASSQTVYLEYPYLILVPGGVPTLGASCNAGAQQDSISITSRRGVALRVRLCLLYASESRITFDHLDFQIPESDEDLINVGWWLQTLKNAGMYFGAMLASLVGLWIFAWTVGWIARGFVGVPQQADGGGNYAGGALSVQRSPSPRSLMTVVLPMLLFGILSISGFLYLEDLHKTRISALAQVGQAKAIQVIEAREVADRARELAEFRNRKIQEDLATEVWAVNLAGYRDIKAAKQYIAELARYGIPSFTEPRSTTDGLIIQVFAGPFRTLEAAEDGRNRHRSYFGYAGSVIRKN